MIINRYTISGHLGLDGSYFSIADDEKSQSVISPFYPNEEAYKQALTNTILLLRTIRSDQQQAHIQETAKGLIVQLFDKAPFSFSPTNTFLDQDQISTFLSALHESSKANTFTVHEWELGHQQEANDIQQSLEYTIFTKTQGIVLSPLAATEEALYSFYFENESGERLLSGFPTTAVDIRDGALQESLRQLLLAEGPAWREEDGQYWFEVLSPEEQAIAASPKLEQRNELEQRLEILKSRSAGWAIVCLPEYQWIQTEPSELNLSVKKALSKVDKLAGIPAAALLNINPCAPIFHLLRPYGKADAHKFFGREKETEALYEQIFDTRLVVLHGERAVGKTSLVRCGLSNKLKAERWHEVHIKRWLNINRSLEKKLRKTAEDLGLKKFHADTSAMDMLRTIYQETFQPVLLVFDQLETLFTLPYVVAEQEAFFSFLQELVQDTSFPAKVLLVVRDEYLAQLADYETIMPTLLDHRFHLKHLSSTALTVVLNGMLGALMSEGSLQVQSPEVVVDKIKEKLAGNKPEVGLACTQIYLHQTHQLTCGIASGGIPVFTPNSIDQIGSSSDAMSAFMDQRIAALEKDIPEDNDGSLANDKAKEIQELVALQDYCSCPDAESKSTWLAMWHQRKKKNRWLIGALLLSLLGLLLSGLALGGIYFWMLQQDPCKIAQEADSCETRISYLCNDDIDLDSECARSIVEKLDAEACPVWLDYQAAVKQNTCSSYQTYLTKYSEQGVCVSKFYQILAERACPTAIDTVTAFVRDTVYQIDHAIPDGYVKTATPGDSPDCQEMFGEPTIRLGPLFMMTSDLDDGARYDWVGALAACRRFGPGWRLPCAGELEFILDKHYSSPSSAFDNLTKGACPLFPMTNSTLSGSFWTATEANDQTAWSILFDTENRDVQMVFNTDKATTMSCRCVYRDPSIKSGIPVCLEKEVYRPRE